MNTTNHHESQINSNQDSSQFTNQTNLNLNQVPSQLTIIDLDPPPSILSNQIHNLNYPTSTSHSIDSSSFHSRTSTSSGSNRRISNTSNLTHSFDSHWRRRFFEQMNLDFESGFNRSQAVNRLRQRMNQLRSSRQSSLMNSNHNHENTDQPSSNLFQPPSVSNITPPSNPQFGTRNLVHILHQVRSQRDLSRKLKHHYTYLLYCGHTPDSKPSNPLNQNSTTPLNSNDSSNSSGTNESDYQVNNPFSDHRGCGKLITIRGTLMNPKTSRGFMHDGVTGDSYSNLLRRLISEHLLLTSDSYPLPDSADRVDHITQESFEADSSNLFHRASSNRLFCSCEKNYLGCLSCGNIVGHTVTTLCRQCQEHSTLYQHFYYSNRLTAIPRFINGPIPFELQNARISNGSPDQKLMTWTQALLRKKSDTEAGYVGNNNHHKSQSSTSVNFKDSFEAGRPPRLSKRVRNAILMGSMDNLLEDMTRNHSTVNSSSSFNTVATTLVDHPISSLTSHPYHLPISSLLTPTMRRSLNVLPITSSNSLLGSASIHNRLWRTGLRRRPAVRISHNLGIRSSSSSRSIFGPISDSNSTSESRLNQGLTDVRQEEDDEDNEIKEGAEEETSFAYRLVNNRRPRIDDDDADEDNGNRGEEEAISGLDEQDTAHRSMDQSSNRDNNDNRASRRAVRRRIHSNSNHDKLSGAHLGGEDENTILVRFSSKFTWSGDVCAR